MNRISDKKKTILKIISITIIVFLIGSSSSSSIPIDLKNNKKVKDVYSLIRNFDINENIINIEESSFYNNFKKLVGNDSEIHFCGPAYIKSIGKGLHMGRLIKLIRLRIPIDIPQPDLFGFERRIMNLWFIFCCYFNDENATTIIEPLYKNETIILKGNHIVFSNIIVFPQPNNFRNFINKTLNKLLKLNITIDFPIQKLHGQMFWYWHNSSSKILDFLISYPMMLAWFVLWPFKIKTQLIGFIKPLEWFSYTPFVIWSNSSIIK